MKKNWRTVLCDGFRTQYSHRFRSSAFSGRALWEELSSKKVCTRQYQNSIFGKTNTFIGASNFLIEQKGIIVKGFHNWGTFSTSHKSSTCYSELLKDRTSFAKNSVFSLDPFRLLKALSFLHLYRFGRGKFRTFAEPHHAPDVGWL